MAIIKVGNSLFKSDLFGALLSSKEGDVLLIDSGEYRIDPTSSMTVTIKNKRLTIQAADPTNPPTILGSWVIEDSHITCKNIIVSTDAQASKDNNLLTAKNSTLSFDKCVFDGEAIKLVNSLALNFYKCSIKVSHSNIKNNVYFYALENSQLSISDTTIKNCHKNPAVACNASNLTLENSQFRDCQAPGVYVLNQADAQIKNSTFTGFNTTPAVACNASKLLLENSKFSNCQASGVKAQNQADAQIKNSMFTGFTIPAVVCDASNLTLEDSQFSNCQTNGLILKNQADAQIKNSTFTGFTLPAVVCDASNLTLENSQFSDCQASGVYVLNQADVQIKNSTFTGFNTRSVVACNASKLLLENSKFSNCQASGVYALNQADAQINNSTFTGFTIPPVVCNASKLLLENSKFSDCQSNGVYTYSQADAQINNSTFTGFNTRPAVVCYASNLTLENSQFSDCQASGVYVLNQADAQINNSTFSGFNTNPAVYCDASKLVLEDSQFSDCQANGIHGLNQTDAQINNSTFSGFNTSPAVACNASKLLLENSKFSDCQASGVYALSAARINIIKTTFDQIKSAFSIFALDEGSYIHLVECDFIDVDGIAKASNNAVIDLSNSQFDEHEISSHIVNEQGGEVRYSERIQLTANGQPSTAIKITPNYFTEQQKAMFEEGMQQLNKLIGLDDVKEEIQKLAALANIQEQRRARGLPIAPTSLHLVFTGNPGTGKTTVARIIGKLYCGLGLLETDNVIETDRSGLVSEHIGGTAIKTQKKIDAARDGILFIDEAYSLAVKDSSNDFGKEAIDTILKNMEDSRESLAVIVAGYTTQMRHFIESNPGLKSRFTRYIEFQDYKPKDMIAIFNAMAKQYEFVLSTEAQQRLEKVIHIIYENRDEHFGNAREIRTLFEKIVQQQALRLSGNLEADLALIEVSDIDLVLPSLNIAISEVNSLKTQVLNDALAELNSMIGLDSVKQEINQLIALITAQRMRQEQGYDTSMPSLHLVFTGNPGTGKTTVARIIGRIYYGLGLLSTEKVIETDRSGLVAGYIGQTAIKTEEKIKDAMNGVLFIDEAYSLIKANTSNDFGQEAIDILLKYMEDKRDRLAVIVAGYTQPMQEFINSNPGLESRFTRIIQFHDYSTDELLQIFTRLYQKDRYQLTPEANKKLQATIEQLSTNKNERFGNGRTIRNLFEKVVERQAVRIATNPNLPVHIIEEVDIT